MGLYLRTIGERGDGRKWVQTGCDPFDGAKNYALSGWLAGIRNYSALNPIAPDRGAPDGFDFAKHDVDYHISTWVGVDELLAVDYEQIIEDRRVTRETRPGTFDGGCTCEPGAGKQMTLRAFLGGWFFEEMEEAKAAGVERIVIGFD